MLLIFFILLCATSVLSCDKNDCTQPQNMASFPLTNETINTYCRNYREYKTCMNTWASRCVDENNKKDFDDMIEKALQFYNSLCLDESFKKDYLNETSSLEKISEDRNKCYEKFKDAMDETQKDPYREDTIFKVCCATKAYQDCIVSLCDSKCTESGKRLYKRLFEMSLEGTERLQCDKIPYAEHCGSGVIRNGLNSVVFFLAIVYSILNLSYKSILD